MKVGAEGSTAGILRSGVPLDLTAYKQVVRTQDFPRDQYVVSPASQIMEINIQNDTNYLVDCEFWTYAVPRVAAGGVYTPVAAKPVLL